SGLIRSSFIPVSFGLGTIPGYFHGIAAALHDAPLMRSRTADTIRANSHVWTAQTDPPPLNGSTLKYGFDHEGGPQWQTSDTSPTRSSRSFGRLRFCAAKAWRWRMPFARSAFPN